MATYYSNKVIINANGVNEIQPKYVQEGAVDVVAICTLAASTTLNSGDTIQLMDVPGNVYITGVAIDTDKLDTGGSPALTISVGDAGSTTRFFNAATTAQAGGYTGPSQNGILGYNYGSTTRVFATVGTGSAGATSGSKSFRVKLTYTADP